MMPASTQPVPFFPGFRPLDHHTNGVRFAGVTGGDGPAVLLLHGYPQTHIAWRRIARALAGTHRLVIPDLPGYGASTVIDPYAGWNKRRVAGALHALMTELGHDRYAVVGHDRGARVGYRLAMDRPGTVNRLASLAVVPTIDALEAIDWRAAAAKFHWFFLARAAPLPEQLLDADPDLFITDALDGMTGGRPFMEDAARRAYVEAFRRPTVRAAICEDYRAALGADLRLDRADRAAGRRINCPVLSLWPSSGQRDGDPTPLACWRRWASDVDGAGLRGGHLMPEEAPEEVLHRLTPFLLGPDARRPGGRAGPV